MFTLKIMMCIYPYYRFFWLWAENMTAMFKMIMLELGFRIKYSFTILESMYYYWSQNYRQILSYCFLQRVRAILLG